MLRTITTSLLLMAVQYGFTQTSVVPLQTPPEVIRITEANAPTRKPTRQPLPVRTQMPEGLGVPYFENFSSAQGMAIGVVNFIYFDRQGYLWYRRSNRIIRYDGNEFQNYNTLHGLKANFIICIFQDRDGLLWFGTPKGISLFDGKKFFSPPSDDERLDQSINDIIQDRQGRMLLATENGLLVYDQGRITQYTVADGLNHPSVNYLTQDQEGNIWIGTDNGIARLEGGAITNMNTAIDLPPGSVRKLHFTRDNKLWILTNEDLLVWDQQVLKNYKEKIPLDNNNFNIRDIQEDPQGRVWVATGFGAVRFDGERAFVFTTEHGLTNNNVFRITTDNQGHLWFATWSGLSKYPGTGVTLFNKSMGMPPYEVSHVAQDNNGDIWFSAWGGGLTKYDGQALTIYTEEHGLISNYAISLCEDPGGGIWCGTEGFGVSFFDGTHFTNFTVNNGLSGNAVFHMATDHEQNVWFATNNGISRFDGKAFTNYSTPQGFPERITTFVLPLDSGNLWVGTRNGLCRFDRQNFYLFTQKDGLPADDISNLMQDAYGTLWIGTSNGLCLFDGNRFKNIDTRHGLPDNNVYGIVEDTLHERIWIATALGISTLPSGSFDTVDPDHLSWEHYNSNTGYPVVKPAPTSLHIDREGIVWAESVYAVRLDYETMQSTGSIPLRVTNVKLNDTDVSWAALLAEQTDSLILQNDLASVFGKIPSADELGDYRSAYKDVWLEGVTPMNLVPVNLNLPYRLNDLQIEFAAIAPSSNKQIAYQYLLEGQDRNWSPLSQQMSARYSNLWEGKYLFRVRVKGPFGSWNETSFPFRIRPPWWRSWGAYATYGLLVLLGIYQVHRYQQKRIVRREREKAQARELAQAREIEKAYSELTEAHESLQATQTQLIQSEKLASLGELTAGIAHEIQNPLNFVNNFAEVSADLVGEMEDELKQGQTEEAIAIAADLKQNLTKIHHHGQRASSIVKSMLQHSRAGTGEKEPTDLNALVDECIRLSYHGMRAQDRKFQAKYELELDEKLPKIPVVPQDIGRVLLNLFNNALYAVNEKYKMNPGGSYQPLVEVSTHQTDAGVEIAVRDNGPGIPETVREKIFQPFFTTKPTGQGTGLGLSLAYDIITKGHRGTLEVETAEGERTTFLIQLPAKNHEA